MKFKKACSNCQYWLYTAQGEEKYGMGVGRCRLNGAITFCEHGGCAMHEITGKVELENE